MRYRPTILTLLSCLLLSISSSAQQIHEYTEEQPLVIVCDWEFPPYEFNNDKGQPDGYNVEVLNLILSRLNIPHRYLMQEWYMATETFEKREADLIHGLSFLYKQRPYVITQNLIHYYRIIAARRPSTPPLTHISQLGEGDTIICKNNDYVPIQILKDGDDLPFAMEYHSPRDGLTGVWSGKYKYFLWGEQPVKWKIREFGLDSLVVDGTDIPPGELRLIGYDKELIDMIDDEYARLEQAGEIDRIRDKWFHPERIHNDSSPIALFIIVGALIVGLAGFLLSRLIRARVQTAVNKSYDLNNMMSLAIGMGDYYVLEHNLETNVMRNVYGNLLPPNGLTMEQLLNHIDENQREYFRSNYRQMKDGELRAAEMKIRWNAGTQDAPDWHALHGNSYVEYENGKPRYIVNSVKDVTREIKEERSISELGEKYRKIFETNLVPMSFYDADGMLLDFNEKMRELMGMSEENINYFRQFSLFDLPILKEDIKRGCKEEFHVCQKMRYQDLGLDRYIEFRIVPIFNENGDLAFYALTARDLTAERAMYLEQRRHDREMHKINDAANHYEAQLKYLLEKSNMYVWQFDLATRRISFSRSLRETDYSMPREEYMKLLVESEREGADRNLTEVMMKGMEFNAIHHFNQVPYDPKPCWIAMSGIPARDKDGRFKGYFGIFRDVTPLMEAQQRLKEETARAEDSGRLKAAFLANMTHEIRTPLNAIVGFSDLLPVIDTQEERMEFIRIIRNNCDMLLRLINDILEASSMGQALAIEPVDVDFAQVFDDICQTLAQRVQEPGVEFVKDNPYDTFRTKLDKGRVQQILTNFTTNAVKYTKEGHIKVGYRQESRPVNGKDTPGIYLYCEDTGAGIPKEKQASIFERFVKLDDFVQGTGLGLSICKSIADRCDGQIGVTSEGPGYGSTFWFWIPCERYANQ